VEDLDTLPLPARHLVDPAAYGPKHNPVLHMNLFSSRGCPGRCAYCAGGVFGRRFRYRSPESMIAEMEQVRRTYGTNHFHFMDDAMTCDRQRVETFCRMLLEQQAGFTWSMMTRVDRVEESALTLLAQAGCQTIDYGVESGHPETLRRVHKPHTVEMVRRIGSCHPTGGYQALRVFHPGVSLGRYGRLGRHLAFDAGIGAVRVSFSPGHC